MINLAVLRTRATDWTGQTRADERIPDLLATPAAVRFVSAEPLLCELNIRQYLSGHPCEAYCSTFTDQHGVWRSDFTGLPINGLDWVIVGGESGKGARPMDNAWAQSIVDQCKAAGVPVFVKQLSSGGPKAIKDMAQFPPALRVRQFPGVGG